jgi:hypothetical protein
VAPYLADDKNQQLAVHRRRQNFVPDPYITDDKFLSPCRTSPTTSFPEYPLGQVVRFCRKPYFADNFPYIADDNPYITDDNPYIADI